jgi:hypothetical protein
MPSDLKPALFFALVLHLYISFFSAPLALGSMALDVFILLNERNSMSWRRSFRRGWQGQHAKNGRRSAISYTQIAGTMDTRDTFLISDDMKV